MNDKWHSLVPSGGQTMEMQQQIDHNDSKWSQLIKFQLLFCLSNDG